MTLADELIEVFRRHGITDPITDMGADCRYANVTTVPLTGPVVSTQHFLSMDAVAPVDESVGTPVYDDLVRLWPYLTTIAEWVRSVEACCG